MATKTFLTKEDWSIACEMYRMRPASPRPLSDFLAERLLARLSAHPLWKETLPLALGSWSRDELCPKSDIDMLFIGPESVVRDFVGEIERQGLKLRYRVPLNLDNWSEGVEPFDILAMLYARPLVDEAREPLEAQIQFLRSRKGFENPLFAAMLAERTDRQKRYDSISQFLEPNLKYGPGGLRDLEQALMVDRLFLSKNRRDPLAPSLERAREALIGRKDFLLLLRQKLQLLDGHEILSSNVQLELAQWFGFSHIRDFMGEVQGVMSDVSFYADWMIERRRASSRRVRDLAELKIKRLDSGFSLLEEDPSVLMQERIRNEIDQRDGDKVPAKSWGRILQKHFKPQMKDDVVRSFFRSTLLAKIIPDLERVSRLVQHDQYHRLTVGSHTMQAVREVLRVRRKPALLGRLAPLVRRLDDQDWTILLWSALYHDLGKGLDGDHATHGQKIVIRDFTRFGISLRQTVEVAWMVQNHLLLSGATFRQNPHAPATWKWLFDHGLKGRRIPRLAVFTAIDIRATNMEAWNDWKERLLFELSQTLESPRARKFEVLIEKAGAKKIKIEREFIEPLDPVLVEELPVKALMDDYARLAKTKKDLEPLVVGGKKSNVVWVRFHSREDRPGLFLNYVSMFYHLGASVQEAFVQTYERFGVYDWFKVKWSKPVSQLRFLLHKNWNVIDDTGMWMQHAKPVNFEKIDLVRKDGDEAIFSFRGTDQKGLLLAASRAIYDEELSLRWARVHTWGRQIDDVFSVTGRGQDWQLVLDSLQKKLLKKTESDVSH